MIFQQVYWAMVKNKSQLVCVTASTVATHISSIMGMRMLLRTSGHQTSCLVLLQPGTHNFLRTFRHLSLTDLGTEGSSTAVHIVGAPGALRDSLLSHRQYLLLCRQHREAQEQKLNSCPCLRMSAMSPA